MSIAAILAFAEPLVIEAIKLIKDWSAGNAEKRAEIEAKRDAAVAAMRDAASAETVAHAKLTAETQAIVDAANKAADESAKP